MPNLAGVLKAEIRRLARKEARASTAPLRNIVRALRRRVAAQKRMIEELERGVRRSTAAGKLAVAAGAAGGAAVAGRAAEGVAEGAQIRFSPRWLRRHRQKLKMSRRIYAKLVGVSAQTIFGWESGRARPRRAALAAWHSLRSMGVREIKALLDAGEAARGGNRKRGGARKGRGKAKRRAKAKGRVRKRGRVRARRRAKAVRRARPARRRARRARRAKNK